MHNERHLGQRLGHHDQVLATHNEGCRGQQSSAKIKYLRFTTSGAAGNGLCTSIKYLPGAAGRGLGTTTQYLRRQKAGAGNNRAKVHIHKSCARIQIDPHVV
jgi:hypothetical protein